MSGNIYIKASDLTHFFNAVFRKAGVRKSLYEPVVNELIQTSLRGVDSHGARLLHHYVSAVLNGRININPKIIVKRTSLTTIIVDADHTFGITAGKIAMKKIIKIAGRYGMGGAVVKNSTHFSAAAIYSLIAAEKDMIGLSFTHSDALVLPYGGKKPYLGTNPICFAVPVEGEGPFCLDMATTQISWNRLMMHKTSREKLELGWAADENGTPCTDPEKAIALLPIATYKGYGLGLMVEIFSSILTGMPFGPYINNMYPLNDKRRFLGHFFMAIDIAKFEDVGIFKQRMKLMLDELRNQECAMGFKKVMVPGDPEKNTFRVRIKNGIPFTNDQIISFIDIAKKVGIDNRYMKIFLST